MSTTNYSSLWDFTLALYRQPGVEALCLSLQDDTGVDVCLLLCAVWLDVRGVALNQPRLSALHEIARPWQRAVVSPLRQVRRFLREPSLHSDELADCRQGVKSAELAAEKWQLQCFEGLVRQWPRTLETDLALPAVQYYLQTLAVPAAAQKRALEVLQDAIMEMAPH